MLAAEEIPSRLTSALAASCAPRELNFRASADHDNDNGMGNGMGEHLCEIIACFALCIDENCRTCKNGCASEQDSQPFLLPLSAGTVQQAPPRAPPATLWFLHLSNRSP